MSQIETKTAALYIRVSTDKQEELSPDSQKRLLLDYAKSHNMLISNEHIYMENGISGRKADKRPQFLQMISSAKSDEHPFDVILVWKFSRFARNQEESIVYKSMLRNKYNVDVVSISEPLIDGPFGGLIERIIEWMDEFYSIRLSGDVMRGMTEKAMRGSYQCRPPLGYRIPYHNAIPEIVPEEAEIVRLIYDKYVNENMGHFALAKYLNGLGLKTSHGKPFQKRSLDYILSNPAYCGRIRWNVTENATNTRKDESEWITGKGHHPAIISEELFDRAVAKRKAEYKPKNAKPAEVTKHWLSGLLKCSACGRTLSSCCRHRKTIPDNFSFQCYGYLKGICTVNSYITEDEITDAVLNALKEDMEDTNISYQLKTVVNSNTRELDNLQNSLKRIKDKEKRIKDAYINGIDTLEEYQLNKEVISSERERLEAALAEYNESKKHIGDNNKSRMLSSIRRTYDIITSENVSTIEKNLAMKNCIDSIVYDRKSKHISIHYFLLDSPES